jgi:hypothetical protein
MINSVQKIFVSGEITKEEAKKNNYRTLIDVLKSLCESDYTEQTAPVYWLGAVEKYGELNTVFASLNDTAEVEEIDENTLYIKFTCYEYTERDEDGEFTGEPEHWDHFFEFSPEDKKKILDFIGFEK